MPKNSDLYGPAAIIERAKRLSLEEIEQLDAEWNRKHRHLAWVRLVDNHWSAVRATARNTLCVVTYTSAFPSARSAIIAAASARAAKEQGLISDEDFNLLYDPWLLTVIGETPTPPVVDDSDLVINMDDRSQ